MPAVRRQAGGEELPQLVGARLPHRQVPVGSTCGLRIPRNGNGREGALKRGRVLGIQLNPDPPLLTPDPIQRGAALGGRDPRADAGRAFASDFRDKASDQLPRVRVD
jgi:hypothetical protein